jgi:hypothetical protein
MPPSEQIIQNILSITLYIGGPIIPLLLLAVMIGNWHKANRDPEEDQAEAEDVNHEAA